MLTLRQIAGMHSSRVQDRRRLFALSQQTGQLMAGRSMFGRSLATAADVDRPQLPPEGRPAECRPNGFKRGALKMAGLAIGPGLFTAVVACSGATVAFVAHLLCPFVLLPLFFLGGAMVPLYWLERRITERAAEFAADYPSVILATAASMKAGMNVYAALERSVQLLPTKSLVRQEVESLLAKLREGVRPEVAIESFGDTIRQPELSLFRTGFLLVIEHGGRFAPTLERLAKVTRERSLLIQAAGVSTTTMRMTANALLVIAPLIVLMIAVRTQNFWDIILHNPLANLLAASGVVVIGSSYAVLYKMSSFKP